MVVGGGVRLLETTGDHRGQLPRTDFGHCQEAGPLKLRLFGEFKKKYVDLSLKGLQSILTYSTMRNHWKYIKFRACNMLDSETKNKSNILSKHHVCCMNLFKSDQQTV